MILPLPALSRIPACISSVLMCSDYSSTISVNPLPIAFSSPVDGSGNVGCGSGCSVIPALGCSLISRWRLVWSHPVQPVTQGWTRSATRLHACMILSTSKISLNLDKRLRQHCVLFCFFFSSIIVGKQI